jgi:predicted dehydrogenase
VILANYYHEHAPVAIKALEAGKHVMSECAACHTIGEGVDLIRTVEKTGKIYMFAENYPFTAYNQEMRRLFQKGVIGDFLYGEGEYVHPDPARVKMARSCGKDHWRNWIPATYYCTHSIAPVMYITDTRPVSVNGFVIPYDVNDPTVTMTAKRSDISSCIILRMDNEAVVKSLHGALRGHQNYTRIHGNKGLMENCRYGDKAMLRVRREPFDKDEGEPVEKVYAPDFPMHHEQAKKAGHGGGDFFTNFHFAQAIHAGVQPYLDVYRGVEMSVCGIQAFRSAFEGGTPKPIPDFNDEEVRKEYENDDWSPDPARKKEGQPWPSVKGDIQPSEEAMEFCRSVWAEQGEWASRSDKK